MIRTVIIDFAGILPNGMYAQYWADYWPEDRQVTFGGDWERVPPMRCWQEPGPAQTEQWARTHDGYWFMDPDQRFLADLEAVA